VVNSRRFLQVHPALFLALLAMVPHHSPAEAALAKDKPVAWKGLTDALLRVNDEPMKDWNIYQQGKKNDPLLLQVGTRLLLVQIRDQSIYEIDPTKVEHKSADEVLWDPADRPAKPLATSDWMIRDVGAAYRISAKLDAESRVIDLQLPHAMNIGDLPARSASPAGAGRRRR